jgi:hypothetical protein
MSLFQKSVEKKYLNDLDTALIDKKYTDFLNHFGNPEIQENIRNSKEEQYQGEFLIDLFVNVLGYTKNPTPNFNLTTELKNIVNSKKADGAILKGEDATAVIELKGTDTTDLDKIETQAFGYKNHHPKCKYVITSNFEKLRFYIQNAVDHVDFELFNLSKEKFSLLWLCLAKDNLLNDLPLKIKKSSVLQEENITKKLYADYSKFREAIYNNLVKNNPETDKLLLFKKTQKLLDRFLFIFFAEDRLLVPPTINIRHLRHFPSYNSKQYQKPLSPFVLYWAGAMHWELSFLQYRFSYDFFPSSGPAFFVSDRYWGFYIHVLREQWINYFWNKKLPKENSQCAACGLKSDYPYFLKIHDNVKIDFDSEYKPVNIKDFIVLCPNCHKKEHLDLRDKKYEVNE